MNVIKKLVRQYVLTAEERARLERPAAEDAAAFRSVVDSYLRKRSEAAHAGVNPGGLRYDQRRVVDAMLHPDRWQPDDPLTPNEAKGWEQIITSPIGRKVDIAMSNMAQQEAMRACHTPSEETMRATGYAAGFRASWILAKALSTMAGSDSGKPEDDASTGAANLDHIHP